MILISNDFWHKRKMYNFDSYNVLLAIATNIPQRLKTASVLQGHILSTVLILNVLKLSRCDSSITIRSAPLADRHRWLRFSVALGIVGVWEVACAWQALTAVLDWTRRDATPRRSLYCKPPAVFRALAFHASRCSPRFCAPRRALQLPLRNTNTETSLSTHWCHFWIHHTQQQQCIISVHVAMLHFIIAVNKLVKCTDRSCRNKTWHNAIFVRWLIHSPVPSLGRKWMCLN